MWDRVIIEADSLVDLLIEEINYQLVIEADSLVDLLIEEINFRLVIVADSLFAYERRIRFTDR